jgi:hypothetical protein
VGTESHLPEMSRGGPHFNQKALPRTVTLTAITKIHSCRAKKADLQVFMRRQIAQNVTEIDVSILELGV